MSSGVMYSEEIVREICRRIAEGEYLKKICREDGMPHYTTFFDWIADRPEAKKLYRDAREMGGHWQVDTILELCDEKPELLAGEDGVTRVDGAWVQLLRVRIDARKWIASKWFPKEYGDKIAQEVTGKDGAPLVPPSTNVTPEQLAEAIRKVRDTY